MIIITPVSTRKACKIVKEVEERKKKQHIVPKPIPVIGKNHSYFNQIANRVNVNFIKILIRLENVVLQSKICLIGLLNNVIVLKYCFFATE